MLEAHVVRVRRRLAAIPASCAPATGHSCLRTRRVSEFSTIPGQTTDETDPRLGEVHVILLSHAHVDHIGGSRPSRGGGTCAAPAVGAANSNSNVATIAAAKNAAIMTANEVNIFLAAKVQAIRGGSTPACLTGGLENEITVPTSSPCTATLGVGGVRTVRRGGASASVRITGVQATHSNTIPPALIDPPGLPPGISAYGGVAEGFVVRFTNGLTAYLTGDTGMFDDMGQVISRFYKPNLMVINMGPGGNGPNSIGPEDAGTVVLDLVRPTTVMPSHVGEQATSGGKVLGNTWTERFTRNVRDFADVVLPVSDVTLCVRSDCPNRAASPATTRRRRARGSRRPAPPSTSGWRVAPPRSRSPRSGSASGRSS